MRLILSVFLSILLCGCSTTMNKPTAPYPEQESDRRKQESQINMGTVVAGALTLALVGAAIYLEHEAKTDIEPLPDFDIPEGTCQYRRSA